jgi:NADH dehydrogenase
VILVVGATGRLGGRIARSLLAAGRTVRVFARPDRDVEALSAAGADVARGDLRDPASVEAACAGVTTVVTTANSARRGGDDTVESVDLQGTANLIDAARTAEVRHFVYTSVLGATEASPVPFLAAKALIESRLRASGFAWTILAPNAFFEAWPAAVVGIPALAAHPVTLVGEGRRRHTFVSEEDVAAFALAAVDHPSALNRYLPIGGPEALTWRDVVAVYERVLGRPIEVQFVSPGQPVPGLPPVVAPLLAAQDTYESVFDAEPVAREFGVRLTRLEEFARRQVGGGLEAHLI